ncbi:hypothetical protein AA13595_1552 [Gluconacetobacter johannae DSM 13595]|uniref:SPOR domain-containing protein n=1 Tax=Gluconacetobacter johannae TaxID=112140 RepID=A0A7W4P240_9PROT|nr:SPOR domain-containing protein [Gluconacetobacter johannae]MBB2174404.1 SPOR domain-containing protein [Gluconacetobacter johannae]GBQ84992.1 hypothetical protein AA13595_1552 [Gluconacetobacter johannae DSM 13595]
MTDSDPSDRDPYAERLTRARERMSTDYDDEPPARDRSRSAGHRAAGVLHGFLGSDPATRRLAYGAAGLGGLLVLAIGGWVLMGHQQSGIPVLGPPPGPLRVRPVDPGGMQVLGADAPTGEDGAVARLAPGPEQPRPDALAQQYGAPPSAAPAAAPGPAPAAQPVPPPATAASPATPSIPAGPATAPAPAAQPAAPAPTPPVAATPAEGKYGVQLAALDSQEAAQKEWARLVHQYPDLFASRTPIVERTERGGAVFYRLRTRGFASIAQATSFCEHVRLNGLACTLAGF